MIKYDNYQIVFREFPNEVTLAINLTMCPNRCAGCHSPHLRENIGNELTTDELDNLISHNDGITCVGFMGGDNDTETMLKLLKHIKSCTSLKAGWYSGKDTIDPTILSSKLCDYIKIGHYDEQYGSIDKPTTNQRMYLLSDNEYEDVTHLFWSSIYKSKHV